MATKEIRFTQGALDGATHDGGQATRYRDARYPNLYLEVGARSKTWRYRKFWKGRNFTETLGTWPAMTVIEAAQSAAERDAKVEQHGVLVPDAKPRGSGEITLREALEQHTTGSLDGRQKKLRPVTIAGYESLLRVHVPTWLDMPIDEITRTMVNQKIKTMGDKPAVATNLLRALSAIYTTQIGFREDGFEHDPTHKVFGYQSKERELLFDEAGRWPALDAISKVPNETRRAAWLVMLFTGLRMENVQELKWQDVDLDQKLLTIWRMKNSLKRTFPLSDMAVDVFKQAPRTHDVIVFEGRHYGKPISSLRQITIDGQDVKPDADGNMPEGVLRPVDCRKLFSSAAARAGFDPVQINWMRGDKVVIAGAANRYMHDLGTHDMANAIAKQIILKCGPKVDLAKENVPA